MAKELQIKAVISADDQFTSKMQKIGRRTKAIGKSMTVGLTLPILGIGFAAIRSATEFNEGMANIATLIPGNIERVQELKKTVQDMAIETGKSTGDLVQGLFETISAFGDSADTAKILGINARAAAAGMATTLEAIKLTSAVTKGYGDTTAEAVQHASNLAFTANKLGQTTFPELAASIGLVVPLATELKVTQEELFGVMATATGVTGKASAVSTQLRGVMQSLMAPTKDMAKLFEALEVESGKALIQQRGLQGTLEVITKAAKVAGLPLQKFIGSIEGQTLALALTGAQADVFTQKLAAMQNVTGATAEAFAAQTQGINKTGFQMKQLTQKVSVMTQNLGDGLAPALIIVLDKISPLIDMALELATGFANLDPTLQTIITGMIGLVAIAGPAVFVIGSVISALGVVATALKIAGLAAVANPLGLVLVVLAGAAALIIANWGTIGPFFTKLWGDMVTIFKEKWEPIGIFFTDLWAGIKENFQVAKNFILPIIEKISEGAKLLTNTVGSIASFVGLGGESDSVPQAVGRTGAVLSSTPPAQGPIGLSPTLPSSVPQGGGNTLNGQVKVSFENAPPGMRVKESRADQPGVAIDTDVGFSFASAMGGA